MEPFAITLFAIMGAVVAARGLWGQERRIRRALRRVSATPIGDVRDGEVVKIAGSVTRLETALVAPLTRQPCVYYVVVVEEHNRYGPGSGWVEVVREERHQPFLVHDESGRAAVYAAQAHVALAAARQFRTGTFRSAPPELEAFLEERATRSRGLFLNKSLRWTESLILEGDVITVGGLGHWEPDPDPGAVGGYRVAPQRLALRASEHIPLLIAGG